MYLTDYHTHSLLSPDGDSPLAALAQSALDAGLSELCLTDHFDLLDGQGNRAAGHDWAPALAQYAQTRPQFQAGPALKLGLEFGMPHLNPALSAQVLSLPELDFVIGSIHNLNPAQSGADFYGLDYSTPADCYAALDNYFSSMEALVATDFYDVLGHIIYPLRYMDVPVSLERYWTRIQAILRRAVEQGRGMELNTYRGRTLADWKPVLTLYRACGGEIITVGSDAHTPADVGKGVRDAYALLEACGFRYVCTYEARRPVFHTL